MQHSALNETERLRNWLAAGNGQAPVIIGTRSAVWTPLKSPGIYVVDEEHDPSYKQDSGFRYSAKDIAVVRGKFDNVPVVLGSATPSLESIKNIRSRKYTRQYLPSRASGAKAPDVRFINLKNKPVYGAVSKTLLDEIAVNLEKNNQVLLFLNRRGYAPVILCHSCGWHAECDRCSVKMTYHKDKNRLVCHHCDARRDLPAGCRGLRPGRTHRSRSRHAAPGPDPEGIFPASQDTAYRPRQYTPQRLDGEDDQADHEW